LNQLHDLQKLKTIAISERNYTKLKSLGKMGMSFDEVLSTVLQQVKEENTK
jgi:predicted CopG family antitoxin